MAQVNLGIPSGSNLATAHKINAWLERHSQNYKIEKIFVFQTDYIRDAGMIFEEDYNKIDHADALAHIMISRFYHRLDEISKKYQIPIYLIGGVSDTLSPSLVRSGHGSLEVACQSLTNLLIHDTADIDTPCLSWYTAESKQVVDKMKTALPRDSTKNLLNCIDLGIERESQTFSHAEWFWPDGFHPNRYAHKKLYDFLVAKNYL